MTGELHGTKLGFVRGVVGWHSLKEPDRDRLRVFIFFRPKNGECKTGHTPVGAS